MEEKSINLNYPLEEVIPYEAPIINIHQPEKIISGGCFVGADGGGGCTGS